MFSSILSRVYFFIAVSLYSGSAIGFDNFIDVRVMNYPPQYFIDKSQRWTGSDVELARAVIEGAGFQPRFYSISLSGALSRIKTGELHFIMYMNKTPERSEYMNWIGPERKVTTVLIVNRKDIDLPVWSLDDLPIIAAERSKKFGITANARYSEEFNKKIKENEFSSYFETVTSGDSNIRKLIAGRILGFFGSRDSIEYKIKHDELYKDAAIHSFILVENYVYFGISKKVPEKIYSSLKKSFEKLEENGVLDEIRNREW